MFYLRNLATVMRSTIFQSRVDAFFVSLFAIPTVRKLKDISRNNAEMERRFTSTEMACRGHPTARITNVGNSAISVVVVVTAEQAMVGSTIKKSPLWIRPRGRLQFFSSMDSPQFVNFRDSGLKKIKSVLVFLREPRGTRTGNPRKECVDV